MGALLLVGLSACQTTLPTFERQKAKAEPVEAKPVSSTEAPDIQPISMSNLPEGECGMLLWAREADQPVLVFRSLQSGSASMVIEGEDVELTRLSATGESRYGMNERTIYQAALTEGTVEVTLNATFGVPFEGGAYVEQGLMTLTNQQGWERVTPVAGLVGCRA